MEDGCACTCKMRNSMVPGGGCPSAGRAECTSARACSGAYRSRRDGGCGGAGGAGRRACVGLEEGGADHRTAAVAQDAGQAAAAVDVHRAPQQHRAAQHAVLQPLSVLQAAPPAPPQSDVAGRQAGMLTWHGSRLSASRGAPPCGAAMRWRTSRAPSVAMKRRLWRWLPRLARGVASALATGWAMCTCARPRPLPLVPRACAWTAALLLWHSTPRCRRLSPKTCASERGADTGRHAASSSEAARSARGPLQQASIYQASAWLRLGNGLPWLWMPGGDRRRRESWGLPSPPPVEHPRT